MIGWVDGWVRGGVGGYSMSDLLVNLFTLFVVHKWPVPFVNQSQWKRRGRHPSTNSKLPEHTLQPAKEYGHLV